MDLNRAETTPTDYIKNPILPGFNPDPSIIRVGDDYYIATSTFEWYPGVLIYHSKDLKNWRLTARPLSRLSQLDLTGVPSSGGIWAPCLSYNDGTYYLCYTIVLNHDGIFWNMHNYIVTSNDICDEWSEPIYLHSDGFDPSLFHDDDGTKWLVHRSLDYRNPNRGIALQEYSEKEKKLIGKQLIIFKRSDIGDAEAPHIYKLNGWYYLIVAEGGTGLGHCVTVMRAKNIEGPYEPDPQNPMLTSRDDLTLPLQKAGHADIVQTQTGEWYMVHLCGRPIKTSGLCTLGRETCLEKVVWTKEGWLRIEGGDNKPMLYVPAPKLEEKYFKSTQDKDDFDSTTLDINFQTLRIPIDEFYITLKERPGYLRLKGRESLNSRFKQSIVARRQLSFCFTASTCVEFEPLSFKHMAGLTCYYNTMSFHYLKISYKEGLGKSLEIITCDNEIYSFPVNEPICIEGWKRCYLKSKISYQNLQFLYSKDGVNWNKIGPVLDAGILSDEHVNG